VNAKQPKGGDGTTQFARALDELNIDILCANSPQAKGRVERANQTLQDRLVKELRLRDISDVDAANAFAPEFIGDFNRRFALGMAGTSSRRRRSGRTAPCGSRTSPTTSTSAPSSINFDERRSRMTKRSSLDAVVHLANGGVSLVRSPLFRRGRQTGGGRGVSRRWGVAPPGRCG
jgi:hypothetical protein